jgi:hypothetical protein
MNNFTMFSFPFLHAHINGVNRYYIDAIYHQFIQYDMRLYDSMMSAYHIMYIHVCFSF